MRRMVTRRVGEATRVDAGRPAIRRQVGDLMLYGLMVLNETEIDQSYIGPAWTLCDCWLPF